MFLKTPACMLVPFIEEKKVISQVRIGFILNEYRYKIGSQEYPLCSCGAIGAIDYLNCECKVYKSDRQKLLTQLFYQTKEQYIGT